MFQAIDIFLTAKLYKEQGKHMSPSEVVINDIFKPYALKMSIAGYIDKQARSPFF